ncbi:MAG: hypothetical protein HDR01_12580 [Lachnospiraceae bacterium]|nr:hypothetical protein [Lachnospiraceae bacterium]
MKRKKRWIYLLVFLICLLVVAAAFCILRFRGGVIVHSEEDVIPDKDMIFYRQDDESWARETLGDSVYTMEKSGCLVCCIASAVSMAGEEKTPYTLNEEFSRQQVFDGEGNLLWEKLRGTGEYEADVFREVTSELLMECLKEGKYPIVRVRMYGLGNLHYVLIVKAENGNFYCMDPLQDDLISLSRYGNRIYAVRCVTPH